MKLWMALDAAWSPQWVMVAYSGVIRASILLIAGALLARVLRERHGHVIASMWGLILFTLLPFPWLRELPFAWRLDALPGILALPIATAGRTMVLQSSSAAVKLPWTTIIAAAWLIGVIVVAVHSCYRISRFHSIAKRALPMSREWDRMLADCRRLSVCERAVSLRVSDHVLVPFAIGIVRPMIVFPPSALRWSHADVRSVMLHELTHIKRYDTLIGFFAQCACAMWWFHPAVWYGMHALCDARERACDAAVVSAGIAPSDYAECLLFLSGELQPNERRPTSLYAPHFLRQSSVGDRIRAILGTPAPRSTVTRSAFASAVILSIAIIIGSMRMSPSTKSLWRLLGSSDWAGRAYAAETIARLGGAHDSARLTASLRMERDQRVHAHARYGAYLKRCAESAGVS